MSSQNHFTFQIKNPGSTKNKVNNNMVAMKRIENYSYALIDEIGLGFTSHVYKGKCQITNQPVAVKVIQLKSNQDQLQANFLKEEVAVLQTIKNADSTNLLKLQKVIKTKNNLYIITQFCEGSDLAKVLRKRKLFSQDEAQTIMKQLINGYKELYRLRIIHRDLKLANLFVTKGKLKIADFGFAISQLQSFKKIDYNVGSPYYMPPQSLKQNQYSFESDVWAIGVIAFQLVYGRVPWKDKNDQMLYQMILQCPVDRLFDHDKLISDHYKRFIIFCLNNEKRNRANPQFIINYKWPMALQYIKGLQVEENQHNRTPLSLQARETFRFSLQKPELRKIPSDNYHSVGLKKRTPSVDNLKILDKKQQPMVFWPRAPVVKEETYQSIIRDQKNQNWPKKQKNKIQLITQVEQIILQFIHFCRFMAKICNIIRNSKLNINTSKIQSQILMKLSKTIKKLVKMAQSEQNTFRILNWPLYIKSQNWQKLRQVIYMYDMKFREQIKQQFTFTEQKQEQEIIRVIQQMKSGLPQNLKILQYLVYYYQMSNQLQSQRADSLNLKINYIVDQCKTYQVGFRFSNNQVQIKKNHDRLLKKLAFLGI